MSDQRLRETERRWKEQDDPTLADVYDRAYLRAGEGLSPPRRQVYLKLLSKLRDLLLAAFRATDAITPCCHEPVWLSSLHVRDFTADRAIICGRCTWIDPRLRLGNPDLPERRPIGRPRQLATLRFDVESFPVRFQREELFGPLDPAYPAPFPTRFLSSLLLYGQDTNGVPHMLLSTLLSLPLGAVLYPRRMVPTGPPEIGFGGEVVHHETITIDVDPPDPNSPLAQWFAQVYGNE